MTVDALNSSGKNLAIIIADTTGAGHAHYHTKAYKSDDGVTGLGTAEDMAAAGQLLIAA